MVVVSIFAVLVIAMTSMTATVVIAVISVSLAPVLRAIAGRIFLLVPVVLHEINRLATSVVTAAMLVPVFFVALRHTQVNG